MTYLLLLVALLVFVLGFKGTAELALALKDVEQRRSLLARVAGFVAMSAWLHALPALLAVVYMRHEGLLAAEVLSHDDARTTVVGLFALPFVVFLILVSSWGALWSFMTGSPWRLRSAHTLFGIGGSVYVLVLYALDTRNVLQSIFLLFLITPFSVYLSLALITPLTQQIRLYWAPFAVVFAVSLILVLNPERTHSLVSAELRKFGAGGGKWVVAKHKDLEIDGRLILLSEKSAYVREMLDYNTPSDCIVRLPTEDTVLATNDVTPLETPFRDLDSYTREVLVKTYALPDYSHLMSARGKTARETTTRLCRSTIEAEEWARTRRATWTELSFSERIQVIFKVLRQWFLPREDAKVQSNRTISPTSVPPASTSPSAGSPGGERSLLNNDVGLVNDRKWPN